MARALLSSKQIVYVSLAGDVLVFVTKLAAAIATGSSSMMSEAVHTFVDTANDVLLLYGYRRAERAPDVLHPLGYGRELYFWSFVVALMLFCFGAIVALSQGWQQITRPEPIEHQFINHLVLLFSFIFEGASWITAFRRLRTTRGDNGYWEAVRKSKDPPSFMVLFEDSAALIGISIAALGISLSKALGMPILDGVASLAIGIVLAVVAAIIARESKSLLIGERASPILAEAVVGIAKAQDGITGAHSAVTVHLAPDQIMVALSVEFDERLHAREIEGCVCTIEDRVKTAHPEIVMLFVKPQTNDSFQAWKEHRFGIANEAVLGM